MHLFLFRQIFDLKGLTPLIKSNLNEFPKGWFLGNFEPSMLRNSDFEVAVKRMEAGTREPMHYQKEAVEFTVVISGKCILGGIECNPDDILQIDPWEAAEFEALEDCVLLAVKSPSLPADKVEGSP